MNLWIHHLYEMQVQIFICFFLKLQGNVNFQFITFIENACDSAYSEGASYRSITQQNVIYLICFTKNFMAFSRYFVELYWTISS